MKNVAFAFCAALFLPVMAAAKPVLYDCDITDRKAGVDWISPKVAVVVREDGSVVVADDIILYFVKKPSK